MTRSQTAASAPTRSRVTRLGWWLAVVLAGLSSLRPARAGDDARLVFNLPAGDAAATLRQLSEASRREILFAADIVRGVRTHAVQGEFTPLEAGNRMLAGTRLMALQDAKTGALAVRQRNAVEPRAAGPAPGPPPPVGRKPVPPRAEAALLQGRVSNLATGATLEGALVEIVGTDRSVLTEREGTFLVGGVAPGPATLRISYPGLDTVTRTLEAAPGPSPVHEFKLVSDFYAMEAFAVTAAREGNAAAIARQERALTVGNTVAVDAYGNVAKGDLGTFLQRLPGIVGEYGGSAVDAIMVRGLSAEFTTVTMDGTRFAAANPDSRIQIVSGLPSNSIESVEVIKTPTADMDAESLGGVVNLRTRSGFDRTGRALILNVAGAYNETMGGHLDPSGGGRTIFPHVSLDYSDVFLLFGRKLGLSVTGAYQEVGDGLQTIRTTLATNWDYASPTLGRQVLYADQEYHLNKRANLQAKLDYKLSAGSALTFSAGWTRFRNVMEQVRPQYADNNVIDPAQSTTDFWVFSRASYRAQRDFRSTPSDTWGFQLNGRHDLGLVRIAWDLSLSDSFRPLERMSASARSNNVFSFTFDRRANREFPTLRFGGAVPPPEDPFTNLQAIALTGTHEAASNRIKSAKLDVTKELAGWPLPVKVKSGFRVRQEDRDRDADSITGTLGAGSYAQYRDARFTYGWVDGRYPATPLIDTKAIFKDAGIAYWPAGNPTRPALQFGYNASFFPASLDASVTNSRQNDYRTRETIPAGYVQGEVRLMRNLQMTAGLRYEVTQVRLTSYFENTRVTAPEGRFTTLKTIAAEEGTFFPNLQFRYEPIPHLTFRANHSTTIGRPRLSELVGRFAINDVGQTLSFSNPSLQPQISSNYDLSVEYYFKPVGVLSLGVFRKDIKNYVAATSFRITGGEFGLDLTPYAGWTGSSRVNAGDGQVEGMEFNYAQQLSFLPGRLRGFGVTANWTILTSAGDYNGVVPNLPFRNYLTQMRPRSGNAGVTYNQGRWDLRLMWNFSATHLYSLNVSDPSSSEFVGQREQYDFFARLKITRHLNLFLDVINLLEENRGRYLGLYRADRRAQTNLFPRSIASGLQARF